jgi:hypothetical protein
MKAAAAVAAAALAVPLAVATAAPADATYRAYRTGGKYTGVTWEYHALVGDAQGDVKIVVQARDRVSMLLSGADYKVTLKGLDGAGKSRCGAHETGTDVRRAHMLTYTLWCDAKGVPKAQRVRRAYTTFDVARDGKAAVSVPLYVSCDRTRFKGCAAWGYGR